MIRPAQDGDIPKILALCSEFWHASCVDDLGEYDAEFTEAKLKTLINSGVCLVTDNVDGMLILVESTNLCNPRPIAAEVAWYVRPSARGRTGLLLLNAGIRYCALKGIRALSLMYMETSMPMSIKRIYDKLGFKLRETTYVRYF